MQFRKYLRKDILVACSVSKIIIAGKHFRLTCLVLAVHLFKFNCKSIAKTSYLIRGPCIGYSPAQQNLIRLPLSAVNRMNIKDLIRNRTVSKGFLFFKKHILPLYFLFYFSVFDSSCLICY